MFFNLVESKILPFGKQITLYHNSTFSLNCPNGRQVAEKIPKLKAYQNL